MSRAADVLTEAMDLPAPEREHIALALLDSVGDTADQAEIDAAWRVEVERRIAEWRAGRGATRPWADVEADLRARLARP